MDFGASDGMVGISMKRIKIEKLKPGDIVLTASPKVGNGVPHAYGLSGAP